MGTAAILSYVTFERHAEDARLLLFAPTWNAPPLARLFATKELSLSTCAFWLTIARPVSAATLPSKRQGIASRGRGL